MKTISIITVCKNSGATIETTIKSVISQLSENIEYIIIDGGSTDETKDIILKYEFGISMYVSEPDSGIYDAMNKGICLASGLYVNFLNSDDWLAEGVLRKVVDIINRIDADVFYGDVIRDDGVHKSKWIPETLDRLYWWMPYGHQGAFVKRTDDLRFDDTYRIAADYKMMLDLYTDGKKFCYLPFTIAFFGQNGVSNTNNYLMCTEQVTIASKKMISENDESIIYKDKIIDVYVRAEALHQIDDADMDGIFMEYLNSVFSKDRWVVGFGCGKTAEKILKSLQLMDSSVKYFIDNDKSKQEKIWNGFEVRKAESLKDEKNIYIFVLMDRNIDEVKRQIKNIGIDWSVNVVYYNDLVNDFINKYRQALTEIGMKRISEFNILCNMR